MITPYVLRYYAWMQKRYPAILWRGDASHRAVSLTFDDGPHPRDTPRVLDMLEKHNIRATFHLVGKAVERHPSLVKQIHERGHQLALHCYRHIPFPLENLSTLRAHLEGTTDRIADICGISPQTIKDLRPPYGVYNARIFSHLTEWGYRLVMWTSIPLHWMQPVSWSVRQVMEAIIPGAVIVLHDGHGHGVRVAEIVDAIAPRIKSMGYEFIRVDEMQNQRE